jgi:hypothetical protein
VPGYWHTVDEGYQWVSGYWASERATEVEYLPPPPETLEAGPSVEATAEGQVWIPGVWVWQETRYLWRPGFWTAANPDWVWVPAHYEWTPSGFVFVEGYWDYPLLNRGLLFAPVVFTEVPARFVFTPSVVIDVRFLAGALFARPAYYHYYFGDYYDPTYTRAGIYPWFAYHGSRLGYDPLFAQTSYVYSRRDPQWAARVREVYFDRREHAAARPPHTYRQFTEWARRADPDDTQAVAFARPLSEIPRTRDFPVRLERLDERRRETARTQSAQVQKFRTERIRAEQQAARDLPRAGTTTDPKAPAHPARTAPARVKMPEAPRLTAPAPGVGGAGKAIGPGAGTGVGARTGPPAAPRVPDLAPSTTPRAPAKGAPRALPNPEDNLRPPVGPGTAAPPKERTPSVTPVPSPGKDGSGTRVPPGRTEPPARTEPPGTAPPARKEPPAVTPPPRKEPPTAPPVTPPAHKEPPKAAPPRKDKDKD